ncbi:MAG TPA: UDP-3-O-acyl-N-acetylglucosamine deacetylase [Chroococcales cyanobacterium]
MPAVPAPEVTPNQKQPARIASFSSPGLTSRQQIDIEIFKAPPGNGIVFSVLNPKTDSYVEIKAVAANVVNTLRNVVLGKDGVRLCIVEHFLASASLWGLEDLVVRVNGPEMPLGDGSAQIWTDQFKAAGIEPTSPPATIELQEPIVITKQDRTLMALPDSTFSVSYMMDWNHPLIGKRWQTWTPKMDVSEIGDARTFGSLQEHKLLGLQDDVVSLTADGFTKPLRFEDEPVRHKLLDLVGDLALAGVNPLRFKARFISIKGGHELDVEMAKRLESLVAQLQS